jgi:hypothetical protein
VAFASSSLCATELGHCEARSGDARQFSAKIPTEIHTKKKLRPEKSDRPW